MSPKKSDDVHDLVVYVYKALGKPKRLATAIAINDAEAAAREIFLVKTQKQVPVYALDYVQKIFDWAQQHPFWVKFVTSVPSLAKAIVHPENPDNGLEAQYDAAQRAGNVPEEGYVIQQIPVADPACPICHGDRDIVITHDLTPFKDLDYVKELAAQMDAKPWSDQKKREKKALLATLRRYALKDIPYRTSRLCKCVTMQTKKVFVGVPD